MLLRASSSSSSSLDSSILWAAAALLAAAQASCGSTASTSSTSANSVQKLKGRFLHITDIHPDPFYRTNSSVQASCHHHKRQDVGDKDDDNSDDNDRAGHLGTPVSECDTPLALVDYTFDWLEREWADEVDFVIWTGDNARHDIDSSLPRSLDEIYNLNRGLAKRFRDLFEDRGVPVVPSLGNNDIYPHNIIRAGPNAISTEFAKLWSDFVPGEDYHTMTRGIYFSREVLPGQLAMISLNTMYFFENNKVVDGCPATKQGQPADPGTLHLDWLLVQLQQWRAQGVQVWLTGHVPPTPATWYSDCLSRFSEIVLSFQDIVLGQMYGHVNVDTFQYLDYRSLSSRSSLDDENRRRKRVSVNKLVHDDIYAKYDRLPSVRKMKLEDYCIVNTGPSVIPTYLPSVRIWNYNVTDENDMYIPGEQREDSHLRRWLSSSVDSSWQMILRSFETWQETVEEGAATLLRKKHKGKKSRRRKKKKKKPSPKLPRFYSAESPSRKNRYLTPLGYTQYYLPIDNNDNNKHDTSPNWTIEYITYPHEKRTHFLPSQQMQMEAERAPSPYKLEDLTIPSWLGLAKSLTESKKMWKGYVRRMYVSSGVGVDQD